MTKVEAVIQPSRLESVKNILLDLGVEGMTISDARGHRRQKSHVEHYRGHEYRVAFVPKIKLEIVVPDDRVEITVNAILSGAVTGKIGDGKIFVSRVKDAIRIRNHDRGEIAL